MLSWPFLYPMNEQAEKPLKNGCSPTLGAHIGLARREDRPSMRWRHSITGPAAVPRGTALFRKRAVSVRSDVGRAWLGASLNLEECFGSTSPRSCVTPA